MRLLFADTDQLFLELLQRYFCRCGHVTEVATDRLDCMAALLDFQPDLLVLDHALSGDLEVAVSGQIEADPLLACLPVVLIGDSLDEFHLQGPSPLVAYFRKPFKLHDLLAAIESVQPRPQPAELRLEAI